MTFGIIGFGRFGKLWAKCLRPYGRVLFYDNKHKRSSRLSLVTKSDILFLAVPISEMMSCCKEIYGLLGKNTLIVDVCSVKVYPVKIMSKYLPANQPIIATHPLFGPDSARSDSLAGYKIVFCPIRASVGQRRMLVNLLKKLELEIIISTPEKHDRQMASSQALVHFVGRGLAALKLQSQEISTPDYVSLLSMNNMVQNDTWQLFFDMQKYNPFSKKVRNIFLKELRKLENKIEYYE